VDVRSPDYRAIEDRILACRVQIRVLQDEIQVLSALRSHPVVIPVLHYERHRAERTEAYDPGVDESWDLLREALGILDGMTENATGWPTGVSVGGAFISMDELTGLYPGGRD
jgi:hypothetical protein